MSLATLGRTPAVSDRQQYQLISVATFPLFLLFALVRRAGRMSSREAPRSIFAEARATSANALLFAFQG